MRLLQWWVKRTLREREQPVGHLYLLDLNGDLQDLGPAEAEDFSDFLWATAVAYRMTRDRQTRTRLAGVRARARLLASASRGTPPDAGDSD